MRLVTWTALCAVLFQLPVYCQAHGNEIEALGHHWDNAVYIHELHLQMGVAAAIITGMVVIRFVRSRVK